MGNVLTFHFMFFHYPSVLFYVPENGDMVGRNVYFIMYIYIYTYIYMYTHTHTHIYIYIYIYSDPVTGPVWPGGWVEV